MKLIKWLLILFIWLALFSSIAVTWSLLNLPETESIQISRQPSITFLDNPKKALEHFREIWNVSSRPISKARAAYWMGKSYEEIGNIEESQKWYGKGSIYSLTFYGQLAGIKSEENIFFEPVVNIKRNETEESKNLNKKIYAAISLLNEFDKPKLPSAFSKSIGFTLCGMVDEPTSVLFNFSLNISFDMYIHIS